ncbi:hypothetical protein AJ78_08018 [Emergomyces pasteurianus Ep9510]|uniref:C2H2-type domain-containing protein n=1 Tax=Emergomyces pasteurianus Ep9510 TaxID=1447872 RepID=A0A1J9Q5E9_9EURO|nr:hypothetical protein AJ78_08018 [Emergomyces pasteurianus Ep9510]
MATDPSRARLLERAIRTASKELLQNLMVDLCNESRDVYKKLTPQLLTTRDEIEKHQLSTDTDETEIDSEGGDNAHAEEEAKSLNAASSIKNKLRLRYAICSNCDEEFDILNNSKESCCYHPEESVPDYDFFVDHDEEIHGIIDSDETREEFPEGFNYECCGRRGDENPCTVDRHRERPSKKRKIY